MKSNAKRQRVSEPDLKLTQLPPFWDTASEMAVCGAVLQQPDLFPSLADILQPGDFAMLRNGFVWHAFDQLSNARKGIDLITVAKELGAMAAANMTAEEWLPYLIELNGSVPEPENAETYARNVFDTATRIRVCKAADAIHAMAYDKGLPVDKLIEQGDRTLFEATNRAIEVPTNAGAIVSRYYDAVEAGMKAGEPGAATGFTGLDERLGALYPGEVIILAGSEGMGKTTLALSILRQIVKRGQRVALFTLEMTQNEITGSLMAMETGIYKDVLKAFKLSDYQWSLFVKSAGDMSTWPLDVIDEFPSLTPVQLRRKLRKMMLTNDYQAVMIDGLWLMEPDVSNGERHRDVAIIMRDLNTLARDFHVPVLITHQYTSEARNANEPTIYLMSESSGVRRNAQVILGLWRTADKVPEVYLLKNRNGRFQGEKVTISYNSEYSRYED